MSEAAPETPAETPAEKPQEGSGEEQEPKTFDAEYVEKLRKEAAQHRTEKNALAKELDKIRQSSMTETEKAVAEAEARGRTAAATEFGQRLVRTEFDALAGRRNADFDTAQALEYVDLKKFLDENGEPDTKAIKAAVERLVPEKEERKPAPSFGGGVRKTSDKPEATPGMGRLRAAYADTK